MQKLGTGSGRERHEQFVEAKSSARQRRVGFAAAVALAPFAALMSRSARAATNTVETYTPTGNGALDAPANYTPATATLGVNDDVLIGTTDPTAAATLTLSSSPTFGSLDDTNTHTITVQSSSGSNILTFGGSGDLGDAVSGAISSDLLYVGVGANLIYQNGTTSLGLALGQSGNFDIAGTASISSAISDGGSGFTLTKLNAGTLTLSGANTYSGGTQINAGTIEFSNVTAMPASGTVTTNNGGTLAAAVGTATGLFTNGTTGNGTLGGLIGGSGGQGASVVFNSGSYLGVDTGSVSTTYAGAVTFANSGVGLSKIGSNTLTLTGTNGYTGNTNIFTGTLQVGGAGSLGSGAYAGSIYNAGTLDYSSSSAQTLSGAIGGGGGLTKDTSATSTLTLGGTNVYTGATSITAGTIDLANSLALQNSVLTLSGTGALVFDQAAGSTSFSIGGLGTFASNITLQNNAAAPAGVSLTLGSVNSASTTTYTGSFLAPTGGTGGALTVFGFGNTTDLTGTNTYTGPTTVIGGTLNLGNATANGSINANSALVLGGSDGGGTFAYTRTGSPTQTFAGTTVTQGGNFVTTAASSGETLNLGALTPSTGGTVDINPGTGTSITTSSGNTNGIIGGFATYGGRTTWAVSNGSSSSISGLAAGSYTESGTAGTTAANYANNNVDANASVVLTAPITPNSLRFNTNAAETLTLTGMNVVTSGGILVTPTEQTASSITGGTLLGPAGGQLSITQAGLENTGTPALSISSLIGDNVGPSSVALSAAASGRALSMSNNSNSFSGGFYLNGGGVNVPGPGGTALGVGGVYFGNNSIYTGAAGGGLVFGTSATVLSSGLVYAANGNNTSNGDISGNSGGNWNLLGTPGATATFAGIIASYSGGRVANFAVDSGTEIIGNTQLGISQVIANGGTYQIGTGYWGNVSNSKQNVSLTLGGGTFVEFGNYAGTTVQTFGTGAVVNPGASTVTVNNNNSFGTVVALSAAGTRAAGGTVNFNLPGGAQTAANGITTAQLNTNGILGGYATVGGSDWATNATNSVGGNVVGLSASSINSYSADTFGAGMNTDVTLTAGDTFAGGSTNSLRFNTPSGGVTLTGAGTLTSGGILATTGLGSGGASISGSSISGSTTDLVVIQNDTSGSLTISSNIINNASNATGLTKSGAGSLVLTGTNTYTGTLFLNGGVLNAATTNINGASTTNGIAFNGGTLQAASGGITTAKAVTLGVNGGTVDTTGANVTLSGAVTDAAASTAFALGAGQYGGFAPTGVGALTVVGGGSLILSGTVANTFGGGIIINNGTVQDADTIAAGTGLGRGYVSFANANSPTLDLDGHNATIAGLIGTGTGGASTGIVTNTAASTTSTMTVDGVLSETFGGNIKNAAGGGSVAVTVNPFDAGAVMTLSGNNTYSGATTISQGTLAAGSTTAFSSNSAFSLGNTTSGATLSLAGNSNTIASLSGGGTYGGVSLGSGTLTVGGTAIGTTFAGAVGGTGGFAMSGTGSQTLSGASTYSGGTTVNSGTLIAGYTTATTGTTSSTGSGNVTVNGGTLASPAGSNAYVAGTVLPGSGAYTISPGNGSTTTAGTLTMGGLTTNSNTTLSYSYLTGSGGDLLVANGALTATGTANIVVPTIAQTGSAQVIPLIDFSSISGSYSNFQLDGGSAPSDYSLASTSNALDLDISAMTAATHSASASFGASAPTGNGATGNPYTAFVGTSNPGGTTNSSTITVVSSGAGHYTPGFLNHITTTATAGSVGPTSYVNISGLAAGDPEYVTMALTVTDGTTHEITSQELNDIITDLNQSEPTGVTAETFSSLPSDVQSLLSQGESNYGGQPFDLAFAISGSANPGTPQSFGIDLSNEGVDGITNIQVTDIGVVPEPTGLALLVLGGLPLLGRRRRRRV